MTAARALAGGLRRTARSWGLGVLLLSVNLSAALVLALPLAVTLALDLDGRPAAETMMRGFDYPWWSQWTDSQPPWLRTLSPDILGTGFAFKNVDLLLKGQLPLLMFMVPDAEGRRMPLLGPLPLVVAAAYMALQVFLSGGVLSVLRQAQGRWTVRAFLHGAGFYFGRFARIALLTLLVVGAVFAVYGPLARWVDGQAREAVSERTAHAWLFARQLALLAALVFLHLVGTCARVITVVEERSSAVLAVLSALAFLATHPLRAVLVTGATAALALLALQLFLVFDRAWPVTGYATLAVALVAMQALVFVRILLRVSLAASLMELAKVGNSGG